MSISSVRRWSSFGVLAVLAVSVAIAWMVFMSKGDSSTDACGAPTPLTTGGTISLGPFAVRGFDDEPRARISTRQGESRLFAERVRQARGAIVLHAADCANGEAVKLIAIGAAHPISLPFMFPIGSARETVMLGDENWYAIVAFPPPGGHIRLVAATNDSRSTAVVAVSS